MASGVCHLDHSNDGGVGAVLHVRREVAEEGELAGILDIIGIESLIEVICSSYSILPVRSWVVNCVGWWLVKVAWGIVER